MEQYVDRIYGGVGLLNKAMIFRKIIKSEHLDPEELIYIGDEPRDIQASKQANIKCISVSWGFNTKELLLKYDPYILVDNVSRLNEELLSFIDS